MADNKEKVVTVHLPMDVRELSEILSYLGNIYDDCEADWSEVAGDISIVTEVKSK